MYSCAVTTDAATAPPTRAPRGRRHTSAWLRRLLILLAAGALGIGLTAPCMTIITSFGRYDGWLRLLAPEMVEEQQSTYSLLSGIIAIMQHTSVALGLLLLAFSCVFPTLKLMLMAFANEKLAAGHPAGLMFRLAHHAGKFSMLDVMVLALLVIAIKGMPGESELRLRWGVWAFAASVVLSLVISLLLHRAEPRATAEIAKAQSRKESAKAERED